MVIDYLSFTSFLEFILWFILLSIISGLLSPSLLSLYMGYYSFHQFPCSYSMRVLAAFSIG